MDWLFAFQFRVNSLGLNMKKKTHLLIGLALASISGSAIAAEFKVPTQFDILAVNEQGPGSLFFLGTKEVKLGDSGQQQVVVRFKSARSSTNTEDSRGIAESQPIILLFKIDGLKSVELKLPNLYSAKSIDKFARHPKVSLVDSQGDPVKLKQDEMVKSGFQMGRNYVTEVKEYNQAGGVAALTSGAVVATSVATVAAVGTPGKQTPRPTSQGVEAVQQAFEQLSEKEQKQFVNWAVGKITQ